MALTSDNFQSSGSRSSLKEQIRENSVSNRCDSFKNGSEDEVPTYTVINDCVHGHISLHPLLIAIVDTPEFQRLRNLKQTGFCNLVFPGANHTRFEHCLGVSYLAGVLTNSIASRQPELNLTKEEILCVQIAGLCHDLGHGPKSHFWEVFLKKARPGHSWKHEDASVKMLDHLLKTNKLQEELKVWNLKEEHLQLVRCLILGEPQEFPKRKFLFEVVANQRTGVDVDKWDYFLRDSYHLGFKVNFDYNRLVNFCRVINNQICFRDKEMDTLYEMFSTRCRLHRTAYQHKVVKIIEVMIMDAILLADEYIRIPGPDRSYRISEAHENLQVWTITDDTILQYIRLSMEPKLRAAQELLHRVEVRQLYKEIGHTRFGSNQFQNVDELLKQLLAYLPENSGIEKEDVHLVVSHLNYGKGNQNPLENMRYYTKTRYTDAFLMERPDSSTILPKTYEEVILRLVCRKSDESVCSVLYKAFSRWCEDRGFVAPKSDSWHSELTPVKDDLKRILNDVTDSPATKKICF